MQIKAKHYLTAGIFIVAAFICVGVLVFVLGDADTFRATYKLNCRLSSVGGPINTGAPVRLMGIDVGKVSGVELYSVPDPYVVLHMKIFDQYKILDDSLLRIEQDGIVGDRILQIYPGRQGKLLQDGDQIKGEASIPLEQTIDQARQTLNQFDFAIIDFRESLANLNKLIGSDEFVANVHSSVDQIHQITQQANKAIDSFNSILEDIKKGRGTLGRFILEDEFIDQLQETVITTKELITSIEKDPSQILWGPDDDVPQRPLSLKDIETMVQAGLNSRTIAAQIKSCGQTYSLDAQQLIDLRSKGFDGRVLEALILSGR